jgi:hypothetical protein
MENIWDQMEGETAKGYALFLTYRDMGPGRSLVALQAKLNTYKYATISIYSSNFDWNSRCAAWDIKNAEDFEAETQKIRIECYKDNLKVTAEAIRIRAEIMRDKGIPPGIRLKAASEIANLAIDGSKKGFTQKKGANEGGSTSEESPEEFFAREWDKNLENK